MTRLTSNGFGPRERLTEQENEADNRSVGARNPAKSPPRAGVDPARRQPSADPQHLYWSTNARLLIGIRTGGAMCGQYGIPAARLTTDPRLATCPACRDAKKRADSAAPAQDQPRHREKLPENPPQRAAGRVSKRPGYRT